MKESKVSIGLINPKSPENVASVMRAAGNFRVDSVFYTGKRYPRALKLKEPLINYILSLACRRVRNQGASLKACLLPGESL